MLQAKLTDFICLGLIAFNLAISLHYIVANWMFTVLVIIFSIPIAIILLVYIERKDTPNDEHQTRIIFTCLMTIAGGLTAWLII
ncbi:MAG TPA: hypothetical protein V6D21_01920 [Candidatus Obscuribacterales bacterium]